MKSENGMFLRVVLLVVVLSFVLLKVAHYLAAA